MRLRTCLLATALVTAIPAQEVLPPFDAPQVMFSAQTSITSVGDIDADGRSDVLGWYWRTEGQFIYVVVRLYYNRGGLSFVNGWNTTVAINGGQNTSWDTEIAELDGNPGSDIVFAFDRDVAVHAAQLIPLGGGSVAVNMVPFASWQESFAVQDLVVADLDGDGRNDLAVVGAEVRAYRNTGDTLVPMASYPMAGSHIYADDFDGDGFNELVVPIEGGVTILRYGDGQLAEMGSLEHGVDSSEGPMHVVGDIDNDGDADIVVFTEAGQPDRKA